MNVKIIVATHKQYRMPNDPMYLPVFVGAEGKTTELCYQKDNVGDNISSQNGGFCELTGLYWAWKNLHADYIGLVHYRRHFALKKYGSVWERVLCCQDIEPFIGKVKVFVPLKRHYYMESLYSHYAHTHYADQLDKTRSIISNQYPQYLQSFDKVVHRTSGYMFNMFIMQKDLLNEYCTWLFDILFELEHEVDVTGLSDFQKRFYGRISEIIFNVWLNYQIENGNVLKNEIRELPVIYMEKIDWTRKIFSFLKAKFTGEKYEASF